MNYLDFKSQQNQIDQKLLIVKDFLHGSVFIGQEMKTNSGQPNVKEITKLVESNAKHAIDQILMAKNEIILALSRKDNS